MYRILDTKVSASRSHVMKNQIGRDDVRKLDVFRRLTDGSAGSPFYEKAAKV
jgi:hypothetical protein